MWVLDFSRSLSERRVGSQTQKNFFVSFLWVIRLINAYIWANKFYEWYDWYLWFLLAIFAAVVVLPKRSLEVNDPSCVLNNKQLQSIGTCSMFHDNVYMCICSLRYCLAISSLCYHIDYIVHSLFKICHFCLLLV